jgi:hypothetical protein
MTEWSSTGDAAGGESSTGLRRSAVPAPPRPPAPPEGSGGELNRLFADGGPATSAMAAVPATEDEQSRSARNGSANGVPPLPAEQLTSIGTLPRTPGPVRGYQTTTNTPQDTLPKPTGKVPRDRHPQVAVRGPRRAKLVIRRVDPWSVLKFSFLFSVCMLIVWVVAASALLSLLRTMHVFDNINEVLASATSTDAANKGFRVDPTAHDVRLWAAIIGAVNALLFTALATLGAFLYNLISMVAGGVEVTLGERD